jgi:hypothetical protein
VLESQRHPILRSGVAFFISRRIKLDKQDHTVAVSLGRSNFVGIDQNNDLSLIHDGPQSKHRFNLGPATQRDISNLQEYLERLKIHCPK